MSGTGSDDAVGHGRDAPADPRPPLTALLVRKRPAPGADTMGIVARLSAQEPPPPAAPPPPPVAGLTDLVEVGRGGMGVVYRARETRLDRIVAVKVLASGAALTPEGRLRAEREATLLTRVVHPHIVQILYLTDVAGTPAIVMEWIDGASLAERIGNDAKPVAEAVAIVADLARGVAALHARGIIHRDIKPANVLLAPAPGGGRPVPKLVDFGLARPGEELGPAVTHASIAVGTPSFMAPEQTGLDPALGPVGTAADVHALGGLLYWLLAGRAPYDAATTAESLRRAVAGAVKPLGTLVARLPIDLETIVGKCLERKPESRYRSAAALLDDLERFLDQRPISARPAGVVERLLKWGRRRPALAALAASTVVAALALVGGTIYHLRRLDAATTALVASHDRVLEAQSMARRSFDRLTDTAAARFLARGAALDEADREHLRRIRDEYLAWPPDPDAATSARFKAAGLVRVAELFDRLHWPADALDTVRGALPCLDEVDALAVVTEDDEALRERAGRLEIALCARTGRIDAAAISARAAIDRLMLRLGDDPAAGHRLAVAWTDLANVESMAGHHDESLGLNRRAVDLVARLLAAAPDDAALVCRCLPVIYNAAINPALSDPAVRRARFERLVAVAGDGLDRFTVGRDELGHGVLLGLTALAHLDLTEGRGEEALVKARRRGALARHLLGEMPGSEHFLGEVVGAAAQACTCLTALGRPGEAVGDLAEALDLASRAVAAEPAVAARTRVLVEVFVAQAALFAATGRPAEALATQRRVLDVLSPWVDRQDPKRQTPADFGLAAERARREIDRLSVSPAEATAAAG